MLDHDASLVLTRLCGWYALHCDGDWEHQSGLKIGTLDNPGWSLEVNLTGTNCEDRTINRISEVRTKHDWIVIETRELSGNISYCSYGGPANLPEMIFRFVEWASGDAETA